MGIADFLTEPVAGVADKASTAAREGLILFFDTETTGLPDFKARSADPTQPHLVQLALILCRHDGAEIEATSVIVKPDGWEISPEVTAIHGITHERALAEGISEYEVVALFVMAQARATTRIAHNESFDRRIMRIAMTRAGLERDVIEAIEIRDAFCTCNATKKVLNLPPSDKMMAAGMKTAKAPKLEECMQHYFGESLAGAHDALVDARACARIYFALQARGVG